jgi:hypothetical protein
MANEPANISQMQDHDRLALTHIPNVLPHINLNLSGRRDMESCPQIMHQSQNICPYCLRQEIQIQYFVLIPVAKLFFEGGKTKENPEISQTNEICFV